MKIFDLIVVGGGAAGMIAAISASRKFPKYKILIVDKTFALGRKILVCGAGRCNLTNANLKNNVADHYYGADKEFIESVFSQFGYEEIISFFKELGIETYVERKAGIGKVFPVTNQAKSVLELLEDEISMLGVDVLLETEVSSVVSTGEGFRLKVRGKKENEISAKNLIISTGGRTYPALGSDGSGYKLAAGFGHKIIEAVPSALPLEAKNPLSQLLQGTKLEAEVTAVIDGKTVKRSTDDVIFTKYGLSGPAILNISREISIHINRKRKQNVKISLNFFPGMTFAEVKDLLSRRWKRRPQQAVEMSLVGLFGVKVPAVILKVSGIAPTTQAAQLSGEEKKRLTSILSEFEVEVTGTRGWNEAEFTAGGVDTDEVKTGTLESERQADLYFCGEILNVDGDVGGYNLSWAWSSGWVAGQLSKAISSS